MVGGYRRRFARIAQEVEHFIGNEEVSGSTPDVSTIPNELS
jgi:hypothetical protein